MHNESLNKTSFINRNENHLSQRETTPEIRKIFSCRNVWKIDIKLTKALVSMVGDLNFPTLGRLASAVPTVRRLGEHCNEEELAPFW